MSPSSQIVRIPYYDIKQRTREKSLILNNVNVTRNNWLSHSLGNKMTESLEWTITR